MIFLIWKSWSHKLCPSILAFFFMRNPIYTYYFLRKNPTQKDETTWMDEPTQTLHGGMTPHGGMILYGGMNTHGGMNPQRRMIPHGGMTEHRGMTLQEGMSPCICSFSCYCDRIFRQRSSQEKVLILPFISRGIQYTAVGAGVWLVTWRPQSRSRG